MMCYMTQERGTKGKSVPRALRDLDTFQFQSTCLFTINPFFSLFRWTGKDSVPGNENDLTQFHKCLHKKAPKGVFLLGLKKKKKDKICLALGNNLSEKKISPQSV